MSLEGLLTVIGIIIAVYALAQPVQRKSLPLFIPVWLVPVFLLLSVLILIWRYAVLTFGYEFYPWADIVSIVCAFFLPIIGALIAISLWHKAKLKNKTDKKFRNYIHTCHHDSKYDELVRIIEKNEDSLAQVLEPETLDLIFERKFVQAMNRARTWLHLHLFSKKELVKKLPDRFRVTDIIMRELVAEKDSPLHSAVALKYGGKEHPSVTDKEWDLVEKTFHNPEWYMSVRADYTLIIVACETLFSGKLDDPYNQNDDLYIAGQGESTRLKCPVYLASKTHVLMLKKAIKLNEDKDYYVSDLWDLFRIICSLSRYNKDVWENLEANLEYPTPFVFLMKEILCDLFYLCDDCFNKGSRPPRRIGSDLVRIWSICVAWAAKSKGKISKKLKLEFLKQYLDYCLELKKYYEDEKESEERKENSKCWVDLFIVELKDKFIGDDVLKDILFDAMNELDYGKRHVCNNQKWMRKELDLAEYPRHDSEIS